MRRRGAATRVVRAQDIRIIRNRGMEAILDEFIARLTDALAPPEASKVVTPVRQGFSYDVPSAGLLEHAAARVRLDRRAPAARRRPPRLLCRRAAVRCVSTGTTLRSADLVRRSRTGRCRRGSGADVATAASSRGER